MAVKCTKHTGWYIDESEVGQFSDLTTLIWRAMTALKGFPALITELQRSREWLDAHKARTVYLPAAPAVEVEVVHECVQDSQTGLCVTCGVDMSETCTWCGKSGLHEPNCPALKGVAQ